MASPVKTGKSSFHAGNLNFPSIFKRVLYLAMHIHTIVPARFLVCTSKKALYIDHFQSQEQTVHRSESNCNRENISRQRDLPTNRTTSGMERDREEDNFGKREKKKLDYPIEIS